MSWGNTKKEKTISEFNRYYESYVCSAYWSEYFWPLAKIVLIWLLFVLGIVYLLNKNVKTREVWNKKQKKRCLIVLLVGLGILLQDVSYAYWKIEYGRDRFIDAVLEEELKRYPDQLYSAKGELLDDILLKGYFRFHLPTTFLGRDIQLLANKRYTYGGSFPFVVTSKENGKFTIRVSASNNYKAFSEEILLYREDRGTDDRYLLLDPLSELNLLWNRINK